MNVVIALKDSEGIEKLLSDHADGIKSKEIFDSVEDLYKKYPIAVEDIQKVTEYLKQHHIKITENSASTNGNINVVGAVGAFKGAFETSFVLKEIAGKNYTSYEGSISVPDFLEDTISVILGFNNSPISMGARVYSGTNSMFDEVADEASSATTTVGTSTSLDISKLHDWVVYSPDRFADYYQFPKDYDGTGQTIGLIEFGGGYNLDVLNAYFKAIGVSELKKEQIEAIELYGGKNNYNGGAGESLEVMCDIEVLHSLVPGAKIKVYFLPDTGIGYYVFNDKTLKEIDVISMSWGFPESVLPNILIQFANKNLGKVNLAGIPIFVSSGDYGAYYQTKELNVDFSGSSPYVVAVGGTTLNVDKDGAILSETGWGNNHTYVEAQIGNEQSNTGGGGGFSKIFSRPEYQNSTTDLYEKFSKTSTSPIPENLQYKSGIPDVSAHANPNPGYVISAINNTWIIPGGTSLATPLWAALFARCNQKFGDSIAKYIHVQKSLYELAAKGIGFNDITEGNNGYYFASKGWDPVTGLGSPKGEELCDALINLAQKSKETVNGEQQAPLTSDIKQQGSSELDSSTEEHNHEEL